MATARIATDSPTPTKLRNFESVAQTIFNSVEKSFSTALTPAQARTAITNALATINPGGDSETPPNWEEFVAGAGKIIDCVEANTDGYERQKLLKVAKSYLQSLIEDIVVGELEYERLRGLFMLNSQVTNLAYFVGVLEQANAEGQTVSFEA